MCYMTTRYRKMVDELADQLEPGEQVEDVALFNSIPTMCGYFAFAAVSFAAGRLFSGYHAAVLLSSVLSMWMMASAARYPVSDAEFVRSGHRPARSAMWAKSASTCRMPSQKNAAQPRAVLDGGDARSSVLLRHVQPA